MPPRPKRSKGCAECRRMRVKCDEERPHCRRCIKGGRQCPGFPELSVFLSMNGDFTPAAKPEPARLSFTRSQCIEKPRIGQLSSPNPMSVRPSTDWDQAAIAYFFRNYVSSWTEEAWGYLQFLPELYSLNSKLECLRYSLQAISLASLAHVSSVPDLETRSRQAYGNALASTGAALQRLKPSDQACLMTSIFLLSKYEILNGIAHNPDPHDDGLVKLLKARGQPQPQNHLEKGVYYTIHAKLHISSADGSSPWNDDPSFDLGGLIKNPPRLELWTTLRQVSKACRDMRALNESRASSAAFPSQFLDVLETARATYAQLVAWEQQVTRETIYGTVLSEGGLVEGPLRFASRQHFFPDIQCGAKWLSYWGSHIHIIKSLMLGISLAKKTGIDCSSILGPSLTREVLQARLLDAVDHICSSVAFMLGEIDSQGLPSIEGKGKALGAYFLVRSLHVVNMVDQVPPEQHEWVLSCLLRMAHSWGMPVALRARELAVDRRKGTLGSTLQSGTTETSGITS